MSLINRMLRDLSSRQPGPGNVMSGIQLPQGASPAPSAANPLVRLGMLVVLVVAFTGIFWLVFGPKPVKIPQPRGVPAGTTIADATAPPADAQASGGLKMDTQLSQPPATSTPASPVPIAPAAQPAPPSSPPAAAPATAPVVARAPVLSKKSSGTRTGSGAAKTGSASAEELYAQARRALDQGDDTAAEAALIEALSLKPQLHGAREDLGNLRIRQNRLDEAENTTRAGLDLEPAWIGYRRLAARLELARNHPANAIEVLERDPPPIDGDVEYHALLASAYQRIGRHEDASRLYRELARLQPQEANWWAGYGMSRDALGDAAGALAAYGQARTVGGLAPRVLEHINQRTATLQAAG